MVRKFSYKGIIATAFTPFNRDSARSLNLNIIPQYAGYFANKGFGAVLINGTYSEGMSMTVDERMQVANAWSEAVAKTEQRLIVQVGGTNLQDVKTLAKHAQKIHASAILCLPELYYKPNTVEDLSSYLKEIGESAPQIPLFYYHSPIATGVTVNMAELLKKVKDEIPSFAGIKFASAKMDECSQAVRAAADQFQIIVANNYIIPSCVAIGIDTFMPTIVNIAPALVQKIYDLATTGHFASAQEYQMKLARIVDALAEANNGVAIQPMKSVMPKVTGIDVGPTRKPLKFIDTMNEDFFELLLELNRI